MENMETFNCQEKLRKWLWIQQILVGFGLQRESLASVSQGQRWPKIKRKAPKLVMREFYFC